MGKKYNDNEIEDVIFKKEEIVKPDFETAIDMLAEHSIALCKNHKTITYDGNGISPMIKLLMEGRNLKGYSVADVMVGKASAILFVKAGVINVYGRVMSDAGIDYLARHGINISYGTLTDNIVNEDGTDLCPMEKTVAPVEDYDEGFELLKARFS